MALLTMAFAARADFSYTTTRRTVGGHSVAGEIYQSSRYYLKGRKMKVDSGDTAMLVDFDAKTMTTVDNKLKTISVRRFGDAAGEPGAKIDLRETGEKKTIRGLATSELILTVDIDSPELRLTGRRMRMEMDVWLSTEAPGAGELRAFYRQNMAGMPWAALTGGGDQAIQEGLANLQRAIAERSGVPVLETVKVRDANGAKAPTVPQLNSAQSAQMREAMAQLDVIRDKGGQDGAAAGAAIARMSAMTGGPAPASLFEITVEWADFSGGSIPDSVFALPAGYHTVDQK